MIIETPSGTIFKCSAHVPIEKKLELLINIANAVELDKLDKDLKSNEAPFTELHRR